MEKQADAVDDVPTVVAGSGIVSAPCCGDANASADVGADADVKESCSAKPVSLWADVLRKKAMELAAKSKETLIAEMDASMSLLGNAEILRKSTKMYTRNLKVENDLLPDSTSYKIIAEWAALHKLEWTLESAPPCKCKAACHCPSSTVVVKWK